MPSKASSPLSLDFVDALESLHIRLQHSQKALFREAKMTPLHFFILRWLANEKAAHAAAIAKMLGVRPQTMTPIVDVLEKRGLLRRVPNPIDRRATLLVLTPSGARQIRKVRAAQVGLIHRALKNLPEETVRRAALALASVRDSLPPM